MEYLENGDLKAYIQGGNGITPHLRLQRCKQASSALTTLHKAGIFPRNFLLDAGLNVKIADFGGASLDGAEPSATPATRFRHPGYDWSVPPVVGDDIVSLGPLVYFIMTGSYPYGHVSSEEVDKLHEVSGFRMWMVLIGGTWL